MEIFRIQNYTNLSLLILLATLLFQSVLSAQMTTAQQSMNQEEQPSLPIQGTSPHPTTSGSSKSYANEGTPTFDDSSDNHIVQDSQPYTEGESSGNQIQGAQQGYQGQQQFGYPQQGINQPFSANNHNNNNNNQLSPFSKLPFAGNNQQGSTNPHAFFNGAVGAKIHEKYMLVSLVMNLMVAFGVLIC